MLRNFVAILIIFFSLPVFCQNLPDSFDAWEINKKVDWLIENMSLSEKLNHLNTSPRGKKSYRQDFDEKYRLTGFVSCDGPRGIKNAGRALVCFPSSMSLAATWDISLAEMQGRALADQLVYFESNQAFSPGLNIIRHPLAGRNSEYFSEDPVLSGKMAAANIVGLQYNGAIATPKHYAVNPFEIGRFRIDQKVPMRVIREQYLPAFRIAVEQGKPWSVMTSYNSVNGNFLSANKKLIDILTNEWGFDGYIVSDYSAEMESAAAAFNAGTHVEMPGWTWFNEKEIEAAFEKGTLSEDLFNERLRKVLEIKMAPWLLRPENIKDKNIDIEAQHNLVRTIAAEGAVLLKNDGNILPLDINQSIALIGPFANNDLIKGIQGSSSAITDRTITLLDAFKEKLGDKVSFAEGSLPYVSENAVQITRLGTAAQYYNNMHLEGEPVLVRNEPDIQKLSFTGTGGAEIVDGVFGNAFQFSGQTSMRIGAIPDIDDKQDFTWSFWVFLPDQFPDKDGGLFSGYLWRENEFTITPTYFNIFMFRYKKNLRMNIEIPDQMWSNVTLIKENGILNIYVNGQKQASETFKYSLPSAPLHIGGSAVTDKMANAYIDDIRLYNRALTADELQDMIKKKPADNGLYFHQPCENITDALKNVENFNGITDPNTLSARWSIPFTPDTTGKYLFVVHSNGGVRFFVDGVKMYDQWQEAWVEGQSRQVWIDMEQGKTYNVTVEFANWYAHNRGKGGFIKVAYVKPENYVDRSITQATQLAANADVAIVAVGIPQKPFQGESNDLDFFKLPAYQNELIEAVSRVNKNTIVVLFTAGGVDMRSWVNKVPGIIEMFHPGESGGHSLVDIVYGDVNPSGKLPVSYANSIHELEVEVVQEIFENILTAFGYKMYDRSGKTPLFPFGFGLSYTTFEYLEMKTDIKDDTIRVSVLVKNTGSKQGAETVQIYVSEINPIAEQPIKELGGFSKVRLEPGESKWVDITLEKEAFEFYCIIDHIWKQNPGIFKIMAASSSRRILLEKDVFLN